MDIRYVNNNVYENSLSEYLFSTLTALIIIIRYY